MTVVITGQWAEAIGEYLTHLRAAGASPGTLRLRRNYLQRLAETVAPTGPWDATPDQLTAFLSRDTWAPETRKSVRSSLRNFYAWAEDTDRVCPDPARRLPTVRVPAGVPRPAPEQVLTDALRDAAPRERLMVMLAAYAGLRGGEIAKVHTRDVTTEGLRIRGKGGVVRVVPLHPGIAETITGLPGVSCSPAR